VHSDHLPGHPVAGQLYRTRETVPPELAVKGSLRCDDAQRQAVGAYLAEQYAAGRLSQEEADARITYVFSAVTCDQLRVVLKDLPETSLLEVNQHPSLRVQLQKAKTEVAMLEAARPRRPSMAWLLTGLFTAVTGLIGFMAVGVPNPGGTVMTLICAGLALTCGILMIGLEIARIG